MRIREGWIWQEADGIIPREPDFPICNDPLGYADLVLNVDVKKYLDTVGMIDVLTEGHMREI